MRYGVNLLNFGTMAAGDAIVGVARDLERRGFHFAMVSDHVVTTDEIAELYPDPFYDPLIALAAIAGATTVLELGTTVLVLPYRHPLNVARMTATLDQLSGGRLILGVGTGWSTQAFAAVGADHACRGDVTDEYLEVILRAWAGGTLSFDGAYVSFAGVHTSPTPSRRPRPPVWVGGNSGAAMRRAVRCGDAWHPIYPAPGWLRDAGVPTLRRMAAEGGRAAPAVAPRILLAVSDTTLPDARRLVGEGTPEQVRDDLDELAALGVEEVLFDTYHPRRRGDVGNAEELIALLADTILDLEPRPAI